jgi:peptidyl-prolyl cis-trans isomerase C
MKNLHGILIVIIIMLWVTSCSSTLTQTPLPGTTLQPGETEMENLPTETVPIPTITPTLVPAAAWVNGEPIYLSDFEEDFQRYLASQPTPEEETDEEIGRAVVLENMIDILLLAQAAREAGFVLDEVLYEQRFSALVEKTGGQEIFNTWLKENQYSAESFARVYRLDIEASWMRDRILAEVPTSMEQIRARQIMVQGKALAEQLHARLVNGADFATLAWGYDPLTGGELGWFPRNYLVLVEVENAVFDLQPGEFTEILETDYGYQIVQVMEREPNRPLTQDALFAQQRLALAQWMESRKTQSEIRLELN